MDVSEGITHSVELDFLNSGFCSNNLKYSNPETRWIFWRVIMFQHITTAGRYR